MTKHKDHSPPMDEIVFEYRNKTYGAYLLRKTYKKNVTRALLLAVAILIAGLVYPLVSSYYAQRRAKYIEKSASAEFIDLKKPMEEAPPPPPPPPPPAALEQKVKFVAPVVTTEEVVEEDVNVFNQDDLNKTAVNEPVAAVVEEAAPVETQEVIEVEESKPIFSFVEEMPTFVGGDAARLKFLSDNIVYPQAASENGIQGTVYVQFVIDSKGNVTDVKVARGIGGGCDEEAVRVVKMMPPWHPGKQNGKQVRVYYSMPIYFRLQNSGN